MFFFLENLGLMARTSKHFNVITVLIIQAVFFLTTFFNEYMLEQQSFLQRRPNGPDSPIPPTLCTVTTPVLSISLVMLFSYE